MLVAGAARGAARSGGRGGGTARARARDPRDLPGIASRAEIRAAAGSRAVARRARHTRPSLQRPAPGQVGHRLGRARGVEVWASVEDSMLLLGPPRSGKGLHVVIPMILDAPGAVVATSTRPDNLAVTLRARRAASGPVAVFDPQQLAAGVPGGLRWSPVRGCELPQTAMIRARGLAAGIGMTRGVEGGDFWAGQTESVLRGLLHAAAIDGRGAADLYRWSLDPVGCADAVTILDRSGAAPGWDEALDQAVHADPRTRDSIWLGVRQALSSLADPRVLDAVTPRPGEAFDPAAFLTERGTLYVLGTSSGAGAAAALVAALVEDMVETARRIAAASPGARLDPPLLLALDEIGNLAPLPSLPALMTEGGGTGHHHPDRPAVAVPGPRPVGRAGRQHHLGRRHRQDHPRRRQQRPRPRRPRRPHRRTRRGRPQHLPRLPRRTHHVVEHPTRPGDGQLAAADPAVRHRGAAAALRAADRARPAALDRPPRRRWAHRRPCGS